MTAQGHKRLWCLDTNILVSALSFRGTEHTFVLRLFRSGEIFLWFPYLEEELREVLARRFPAVRVKLDEVFLPTLRLSVGNPPRNSIVDILSSLRKEIPGCPGRYSLAVSRRLNIGTAGKGLRPSWRGLWRKVNRAPAGS